MILRIQKSRGFKIVSVFLILNILAEIAAPTSALALTGGPAQPEFGSFTPIGVSDMVDLSSGDMTYNIPLVDVGGYPLNIAYSSDIGMDDEASWVGLGWNLSAGQINRNVRGLPDDFKGDMMTYENNMKPNITVGASFRITPDAFGVEIPLGDLSASLGVTATYNNYEGFTMKPSVGVQLDLGSACSVGFNAENGPDGLSVSPSVSIHSKKSKADGRNSSLTGTVGVTMNSRQGLTATTLSMTRKSNAKAGKNATQAQKDDALATKANASVGSSIGFTDELYTPSKRVSMNTESFTVNAALGGEIFGGETQGQITAFGTIQSIASEELNKQKAAYGYENTDLSDRNGILDFNREKDGAVNVNSTNLPLTNYTYDIYSIQGQGVSGMYRPFRNQVGYIYDTYVTDGSTSTSLGVELGMGNAVHGGVDFESTTISSASGVWENDNAIIQYLKETYGYNPRYEKVHFKNVGDLSVDQEFSMFDQTARYSPVRVPFVGSKFQRSLPSQMYYKYNALAQESSLGVSAPIKRTKRKTRNQSIRNVTIKELRNGIGYGPCVKRSMVVAGDVGIPGYARDHHTGEVQVIRNDGARYIYGLPLYNVTKREASFSVDASGYHPETGLVTYGGGDNSTSNDNHNENFSRTTTPAYVHTYLLTSILSTDYQDQSGNGPSDDDLGSYTKFSYVDKLAGNLYKWRVPLQSMQATFNGGLNADEDDDEASYVYGTKEQKYVHKIETKTHIAYFDLSPRKDAKGVNGEDGGMNTSNNSYKLDKIRLYSKAEILASGGNLTTDNVGSAKAIKTVNFEYSYSLCTGVPNNNTGEALSANEKNNKGGKLTLKKIYFTYRDSNMGKYTGYRFNYGEYADGKDEYTGGNLIIGTNNLQNPKYDIKGYDSWGKYKPSAALTSANNTDPVTASEFPFTEQDKSVQDGRSSVWCLKSIHTPSGGNISVEYESDDYNYVQDKKALKMYKVVGAGTNVTPSVSSDPTGSLYTNTIATTPTDYLYVQVPDETYEDLSSDEYKQMFLSNLEGNIVQFRFFVNMTKAGGNGSGSVDGLPFEYISGYAELDMSRECGIYMDANDKKFLSVPIKTVNIEGGVTPNQQVNPISKAAWNFGRKYLSKQVYGNAPSGNSTAIQNIVEQMLSSNVLSNLKEIFTGPNVTLKNKFIGRRFVKDKSWIRLNVSTNSKLGGGCRVKAVKISDVWGSEDPANSMNPTEADYRTMNYGQSYKYNLSDNVNDPLSKVTSGVATYEPVGNKENPFVMPVVATTKHLLAPKEENYIEKPFGESFFPSPQVTYSRVSVANLTDANYIPPGKQVKKLHRTGKVVNEFFTSRDYPTIVDQTNLQAKEDKKLPLASLLKIKMKKHFTASQGYVVHLNDMDGKQKAKWVYAEGQTQPMSGVTFRYASNEDSPANSADYNKGALNNNVRVVFPNGDVKNQVIGVEYDMVHDLRENSSSTQIVGVNTNLAAFLVGVIPGLVPIPLPDMTNSEDQFRSVATTKVINTFGILVETVAYEGDTKLSTKNIAWDAITGEVLSTETVDEYNDKFYTFTYPAHWFYSGMSQASLNLGVNGKLASSGISYTMQGLPSSYSASDFLMEGDEIVYGPTTANFIRPHAWVSSVQGNTFRLIDATGTAVTGSGNNGDFTVIRSAHRNVQSAEIMNVTLMRNPLKNTSGAYITNLGTSFMSTPTPATPAADWEVWRIIDAGAVDYSDNWPAGCECGLTGSNPYVRNEKGVWRTKSSRVYLTGRNSHDEVTPRRDGFLTSFSPMYKLTGSNTWYKDLNNWTFVTEVSKYNAYGFEIESKDALNRYSAIQYGYNNTFPIAIGNNLKYSEIAFDGFEDRGFGGCATNTHFNFPGTFRTIGEQGTANGDISRNAAHTGKYSIRVNAGNNVLLNKKLACPGTGQP